MMTRTGIGVLTRRICAAGMGLGLSLSIACAPASAQDNIDRTFDTQPPLIEFEAVTDSPADSTQVFTALVVDNVMLQDVVLYHRREGQRPFIPMPMAPVGSTGYFSATIDTDPDDLRAIEYYLQARDTTGHRAVNGYAFDPHSRRLLPPLGTTTTTNAYAIDTAAGIHSDTREPLTVEDSRRRWLMVGLGVLAVGALASLSGQGGNDADDGTVPFSIDLGQPR